MANTCENVIKVTINYDNEKTRTIYVDLAPDYQEFLNSLQSYNIENKFKNWIDNDNDNIEIKDFKSYEMFLKVATKKRIFINYEEEYINEINLKSKNKSELNISQFSMINNASSSDLLILDEEISILDKGTSVENNEFVLCDENCLIGDKGIANIKEIFFNWSKMFTKISYILDNIINIDIEINENLKMLTTKQLSNSKLLENSSTPLKKKYDGSQLIDESSYDPLTVVEILKNFNKIFTKISNALGNKIDIDNAINENHKILIIENIENQLHFLFSINSNIFLEILHNFNEMFSKIFNAIESNNLHIKTNDTSKNSIDKPSSSSDDIVTDTKNLYNTDEIEIPKVNYVQLSRSLFNDQGAAGNLKNEEMNKSIADIIALGYDNEGGWIENLLASFNGDVERAKDFLKPFSETFD